MTNHINKSLNVNLKSEKVWAVLKNYGNMANSAPTVKSSSLVSTIDIGIGAKRDVTLHYDNSTVTEEIIEYYEGIGYKMNVTGLSFPLQSMQAQIKINAIDNQSCEISMSADFTLKNGPVAWLMGNLLMAPMMKSVFNKVMKGLAWHVATGKDINTKLPSEKEWEVAIG